mgnify:CR=1 FL=1
MNALLLLLFSYSGWRRKQTNTTGSQARLQAQISARKQPPGLTGGPPLAIDIQKISGRARLRPPDPEEQLLALQVHFDDLPRLETPGQVHSRSAPTLAAEVTGRITRVAADTGDAIEQGQLLAETDTSTLVLQQQAARAAIERLEVHIANGERRVERLEKLSAKNLSSQTQLDDAREQLEAFKADHKAAVAQLAIVEDSLTKSRVVAPVSGVIQRRLIATGDFVSRGQPLFEITRPDELQAELDDAVDAALALAEDPFETSDEFFREILQLRLAAGELAIRASQSAMLHTGAKGYLQAAPAQRKLRESYFIAIVTPAIKHLRKELDTMAAAA